MHLLLTSIGTHETLVIVVDGIPQSVKTWNYSEDATGNRTFYLEGITSWQLRITAGSTVACIR
jgi:hypothetical protein